LQLFTFPWAETQCSPPQSCLGSPAYAHPTLENQYRVAIIFHSWIKKALTAKEAAKKVYSIAHVIIARALYRAVKLREVGACLKQKIDFWVALMVNESEKPKGKTKSENIGVAEEKNVEKEGGQGACC
jgi:hypothetical protein